MNTPYFEEVQRFRNNGWLWSLIILVSTATLVPMFYGLYSQLMTGVPWGDKPLSDTGLLLLSLFVLLSWGIALALILSLRLEVKIDDEGIHYRLFPLKSKPRVVPKQDVAEYEMKKGFNLFESGGFGYHRNILMRTRSFRMGGQDYLRVKTNNGQKFIFGTQMPGELERALKKMMQGNEMF